MLDGNDANTVELATELTIAWLSNPNTRVSADEVRAFLQAMHVAVTELTSDTGQDAPADDSPSQTFSPAVSVRKSLASRDHIISMIDGKPYRTLRRHLTGHGLTPEQYRTRYNLKADYPIVAESYSAARRAMAMKIGLGQKGRAAKATATTAKKARVQRAPREASKA